MRALLASIVLSTALAGSALAEPPKFIKVDIVSKSGHGHHAQSDPSEVHVRMPIALAKGILEVAGTSDIKVNGKTTKELKVDQLVQLLETAKPGDLLLELTTDKGDLVKITVQ